jgi:DNA-binding transcriptional regulator YiaG
MPYIASVLKAEIARVSRKELKAQTDSLKKTVASQRAELSALRKRVSELEAAGKRAQRTVRREAPVAASSSDTLGAEQLRFRAAGMASNRKRLGLSAADFGLLVGTTGQSIYAWESGKTKPSRGYLEAIAALRGIGKREVAEKLAALR